MGWGAADPGHAGGEQDGAQPEPRRSGARGLAIADDVVIIDGTVECVPIDGAADVADDFAAAAGFDPRAEPGVYVYIRITPSRIQAWRDVAELAGRTIMREGRWLDD